MSNSSNRLSELERKIDRLEKYTTIRDGVWIKNYLEEIDEFIIDYGWMGNKELSAQIEHDNLMMCRAMAKENFLEFCRRVALQIEGLSEWGLSKVKNRDPGLIQGSWEKVQDNKESRWRGDYKKEEQPDHISSMRSMDTLEMSFCVYAGRNYMDGRGIREGFFCLIKSFKIRNIASHREDEEEITRRMDNETRKFYSKREKKYGEINEYWKKLREKIIEEHTDKF